MSSIRAALDEPPLRARVRAASSAPPLRDLGAAALRELDEVLAESERFQDLPGKWQAALLAAENAQEEYSPPIVETPRCCGGHPDSGNGRTER